MCGRFSLSMTMAEVQQAFPFMTTNDAALGEPWHPRYNVAPGADILVVVERERARWGGLVRWGWPQPWRPGQVVINARIETVADKPMFRQASPAIVVADSYYEWHATTKQPFRICAVSGELLKMAALILRSPTAPASRVVIVTQPSSPETEAIHHRMPCLLSDGGIEAWYAGEDSRSTSSTVLIRAIPISRRINNARIDGPELHMPDYSSTV